MPFAGGRIQYAKMDEVKLTHLALTDSRGVKREIVLNLEHLLPCFVGGFGTQDERSIRVLLLRNGRQERRFTECSWIEEFLRIVKIPSFRYCVSDSALVLSTVFTVGENPTSKM